MSRPSIWLDRFDRDQEFEVRRPFRAAGVDFNRGDTFDKTLVTTRTLRQLYESRRIQVATNSPAPPPEPPVLPLRVRHIGAGRFGVFRGDDRLTEEPMTREEAEAYAAG